MQFPLCFLRWIGTVPRMTKRQKVAFLRELTELSRKHGITVGWDYDGMVLVEFDDSDVGGRYLSDTDDAYWVSSEGLARRARETKERLACKRLHRSPEYIRKMADNSESISAAERLIAEKGLRPFPVQRHASSVSINLNPGLGAIL